MESVILEKAPKIAVYTQRVNALDDAVTLVLTYAIPFTAIYDEEVLSDQLILYDWVHLHQKILQDNMESFLYKNVPWYIEQKKEAEN
jgi:hypothetical protein